MTKKKKLSNNFINLSFVQSGALLCAVCIITGYIVSYFHRAFFPEGCEQSTLQDTLTYDTMVRIGGSFTGFSTAFQVVADMYGWKHIVLLADDDTERICWYSAKPFDDIFGNNENYTFSWLRFEPDPTPEELDDILDQVQARARGFLLLLCYLF